MPASEVRRPAPGSAGPRGRGPACRAGLHPRARRARARYAEQLQAAYGGLLGFAEPRLVANFVATLDGIVAIPELPRSTRIISGGSSADRFLLGLLRACADVVLLGAGTLHAHPETVWTGQRAYPAADAFAELRRRRGQHLSPSSPSSPPAASSTPTIQRCAARRSCLPASGGPARSPAGSPPAALSSPSERERST